MGSAIANQCRCCGSSEVIYLWDGVLIGIDVSYFECEECGYVQTEAPYWLETAYSDVINMSDTGIMSRNLANARIVAITMQLLGMSGGRVVDCAGGYGVLVRLLRDLGINASWSDPYCENLFARGFEHEGEKADLVTAFEVFEHYVEPSAEVDRLLTISSNILFSTELIQQPTPAQKDWWYYGREHGQHIGFFREVTLRKIAEAKGLCFISNGLNYHLLSDKPVNRRLWVLLMRYKRLITPIITKSLESKTFSDHKRQSSRDGRIE